VHRVRGRRRSLRRVAGATVVAAIATIVGALPGAATPVGEITTQATGGVTPGFTANQQPAGITTGPDGNVWYTFPFAGIGRLNPGGTASEFTSGITGDSIRRIVSGPDGNLWFTEFNPPGAIGRITPAGVITEMAKGGVTPNMTAGNVEDIVAGPDGNLWFTKPFNSGQGAIGRITPAGTVTEFSTGLDVAAQPRDVAVGPDGNIWFTDDGAGHGRIWKSTTDGTITLVADAGVTPGFTTGKSADHIALGPDGSLWFGEAPQGVARLTTAGVVTEFSAGFSVGADYAGITSACGALWLTQTAESDSGVAILRVATDGAVTVFTAGLPVGSNLERIAPGPDGDVWFTNPADPGSILKIGTGCTPAPPTPPAPPAPAPVAIGPRFTG
jgi:virginiamycin B lyase